MPRPLLHQSRTLLPRSYISLHSEMKAPKPGVESRPILLDTGTAETNEYCRGWGGGGGLKWIRGHAQLSLNFFQELNFLPY